MPSQAPNFTGKDLPWETSVNCGDKTQSLISGWSDPATLYLMLQDQRPYGHKVRGPISIKKLLEDESTNALYLAC